MKKTAIIMLVLCLAFLAACGSIAEAVDRAHAAAGQDGIILAFGSLSFLGELTRMVSEYRGKKAC